ncbi:MAG: dipicolinate synthase subunit DpsA [Peptococcaceae bacterium]|nr:dipicolinate synthase subunit DpsA [Peptococcaceae bacterium]
MQPLSGLRINILGGDARGSYAAQELALQGASVKVLGLPIPKDMPNLQSCDHLEEALTGADALVIPLPGLDDQGFLYTMLGKPRRVPSNLFSSVNQKTPIFVVFAKSFLRKIAQQLNLHLIELNNMDEFAILNSIPSAEGVIQMAMESSPITIHGSTSMVLGFGRTAMTLARMLAALGSHTTVVARNPAALARAYEMGFHTLAFPSLPSHVGDYNFIFNTVPALVLNRDILQRMNPETIIIDLASAPGGVDYEAAKQLNIKAKLAPSLPGMVAPKSAGQILASVIARLLTNNAPGCFLKHQGVLENAAEGR